MSRATTARRADRGRGLSESEKVHPVRAPKAEKPVDPRDVRDGAQLGPVTPRQQKALEDATPREAKAAEAGQGAPGEVQAPGHQSPAAVRAVDEGLRATQLTTQATLQGAGRALVGPAPDGSIRGVKKGQPLTRTNDLRVSPDVQVALDTPQGAGEGINQD